MLRRFLLPCIPLLTGCTIFHGPKVSVQDVKVTQATDEALGVTVLLELRNPNNQPLELHEFRYELHVDGTEVYSGRRAGGATLGAGAARAMTLPAVIAYQRLSWAPDTLPEAAEFSVDGEVRYNAPNRLVQILLDASLRRPGTDFSKRGTLHFSDGTEKGTDFFSPPSDVANDRK